jgi:formylglycine-generating enzyme required for sulfatase activity
VVTALIILLVTGIAGARMARFWIKNPEPVKTNSIGMTFVYIKPGTFMMGSPKDEPERNDDETLHEVTLTRGFYMQTTEVTQGQWKQVMLVNPSSEERGNEFPVDMVSWYDTQEFIKRLNKLEGHEKYRLPTEAEWEYACRANTTTPFAFGSCLGMDQANYFGIFPLKGCPKESGTKGPTQVMKYNPNKWGLYDMHGSVSEWCADWYGAYPSYSVTDPKGPDNPDNGILRVDRGGSLISVGAGVRSAKRGKIPPSNQHKFVGFRLVLNI